jgi:hypothetical protein
MDPFKRGHLLAASFRSFAVMRMMMMGVVVMGWAKRLCGWHGEGNSGDGGQSESKFSHEYYSSAGFPRA